MVCITIQYIHKMLHATKLYCMLISSQNNITVQYITKSAEPWVSTV
jgi:hypothetical protein